MLHGETDRSLVGKLARTAGTLGVILSLLFVGLELRQNRQLARAQVRQGLADRQAQVLYSIAENPELARAWQETWAAGAPRGRVELTAADSAQAVHALVGMLRHVENVYLQYLEGVVDESVLTSYAFRNNRTFMTPQFKAFWKNFKEVVDPRFAAAFDAEYGL